MICKQTYDDQKVSKWIAFDVKPNDCCYLVQNLLLDNKIRTGRKIDTANTDNEARCNDHCHNRCNVSYDMNHNLK
jgi:hypothetical protein